ncbi:hypothetical protein D3C72_2220130 [compost metagenome]
MLEGRKYIRVRRQRDEIGLDGDAAGIVVDMAKQAVLMAGAGASTLDIHALASLDEGGAARLLEATEERRDRHAERL